MGGGTKFNILIYFFVLLHIFDLFLHIFDIFLHIFDVFLHIFDILFLHILHIFQQKKFLKIKKVIFFKNFLVPFDGGGGTPGSGARNFLEWSYFQM